MQNDRVLPWFLAFHRYHDDLFRFFTRKLGCRVLAADCTQDTYVQLVRMGPSIKVQNPRAFLFRVATNLAIDYLRKTRTRDSVICTVPPPEDTPSRAPSPEAALFRPVHVRCAHRARFFMIGGSIREFSMCF